MNLIEGEVVTPKFGKPVDPMVVARGGADLYKFTKRPDFGSLDEFTRGYLQAALALSHDEGDDEGFNYDQLHVDTIEQIMHDCRDFQQQNAPLLGEYFDHGLDEESAGIDFFLTRNHHGAGFWDRGLDKALGEALTQAAHKWGDFDLYLGDDKAVYS